MDTKKRKQNPEEIVANTTSSFFANVSDGLTAGIEVAQSVSSFSISLDIAKQTLK